MSSRRWRERRDHQFRFGVRGLNLSFPRSPWESTLFIGGGGVWCPWDPALSPGPALGASRATSQCGFRADTLTDPRGFIVQVQVLEIQEKCVHLTSLSHHYLILSSKKIGLGGSGVGGGGSGGRMAAEDEVCLFPLFCWEPSAHLQPRLDRWKWGTQKNPRMSRVVTLTGKFQGSWPKSLLPAPLPHIS